MEQATDWQVLSKRGETTWATKMKWKLQRKWKWLKQGGKLHVIHNYDKRYFGKCPKCNGWTSSPRLEVLHCDVCDVDIITVLERLKFYNTFNVVSWFSKPQFNTHTMAKNGDWHSQSLPFDYMP